MFCVRRGFKQHECSGNPKANEYGVVYCLHISLSYAENQNSSLLGFDSVHCRNFN